MTVQSLRLHRVHADILPSLRVSSSQCHFIWSNIGLFHVIYKSKQFYAKQTKSPKRAASGFFFATMKVLFLLLKCLLNEFKNMLY